MAAMLNQAATATTTATASVAASVTAPVRAETYALNLSRMVEKAGVEKAGIRRKAEAGTQPKAERRATNRPDSSKEEEKQEMGKVARLVRTDTVGKVPGESARTSSAMTVLALAIRSVCAHILNGWGA